MPQKTDLQHKIDLVESYLFALGKRHQNGHEIYIIFKPYADNSRELILLDIAFIKAMEYFISVLGFRNIPKEKRLIYTQMI